MSQAQAAVAATADLQKPQRTFRTMRVDQRPAGALSWNSASEKAKTRRLWRLGFHAIYGAHPRHLQVGWCLEALSAKDGFASAGDAHLARETGLPLKSVQASLTALDRDGAIVRVHVFVNGRPKRRIYLGASMANRGRHTPCGKGYEYPPPAGGKSTPQDRGTEYRTPNNRSRRPKLTNSELARKDAERRAARARGERPANIFAEPEDGGGRP